MKHVSIQNYIADELKRIADDAAEKPLRMLTELN